MRRAYYDHEPAYQRIAAAGGRGWDDREWGAGQDSYDALEKFLASRACPAPGRAIDLGCGGGPGAIRLAQRGFATTGVDFAPTAVAIARANAAAAGVDIAFAVADCLDLRQFAGGSFDLAVDNHTLHCILGADRRRFLAEAARLLAPGGAIFSESMSAEGSPDFVALGVDPSTRIDRHRTRYWARREELLEEFRLAGLDVLDVRARSQPERPNPGDTLVVIARKP